MDIRDEYNLVFDIEMEGWCYGIENFPGEVYPGLVHNVIKELEESFRAAIEHFYAFDILKISREFSKAAKYLIHEKEVCFSILAHLPHPSSLNEDQQFILGQIIDRADREHGTVLDRLQRKWKLENQIQEAA